MIYRRILWILLGIEIVVVGCSSFQYTPPPQSFKEADLIGVWQAKYGTTRVDTLILRSDGTYQQIFDAPLLKYHYESPWNEWHIEYSSSGKPKLHLEGMRYYVSSIAIGENGGRFPIQNGPPLPFYDIDEGTTIEMVNKVILAINGDPDSPRNITLWQMQSDPDEGPAFFVLVDPR